MKAKAIFYYRIWIQILNTKELLNNDKTLLTTVTPMNLKSIIIYYTEAL